MLPGDARRRIVVVSDGRATDGDAAAEAARLAEAGIAVEYRLVGRAAEADLAVAAVDVAGAGARGRGVRRRGHRRRRRGRAGAAHAAPRRRGRRRAGRRRRRSGRTVVRIPQVAGASGLGRYQVRVSGSGDAVAENDVGYAAVQVEGPATVLLAEGIARRSGAALAAALRGRRASPSTSSTPSALPPLDRLAGYQSVVLVDVDARIAQPPSRSPRWPASTRDLGHGLVTIGGERSYGVGGYLGTPLEELLPVISEITDPAPAPVGGRGARHRLVGLDGRVPLRRGPGPGQPAAGRRREDRHRPGRGRAGHRRAVGDRRGRRAGLQHRARVAHRPPAAAARRRRARGPRRHPPERRHRPAPESLTTAAEALRQSSSAALKHIILFTDGFTAVDVFDELADEAAALYENEGITVSVIATGEGAADDLEEIAEAGRGRFYPGRDLQQIPQLMMEEAVLASRDFINEGDVPARDHLGRRRGRRPHRRRRRCSATSPPRRSRRRRRCCASAPTATRCWPRWQLGLGRSTSWTSDASARWSQLWATWDGYVDFWSDVVRDTFATAAGDTGVRARVADGVLRVTVEREGAFADGASATARVTGPDLAADRGAARAQRPGRVHRRGPGRRRPAPTPSAPPVRRADGTTAASGSTLATLSYPPEFEPGEPDEAALSALLDRHRRPGRHRPPSRPSTRPTSRAGRTHVDLAPWFVLAACLLWPLAVGLSRAQPAGRGGGRDGPTRRRPRAVGRRPAAPAVGGGRWTTPDGAAAGTGATAAGTRRAGRAAVDRRHPVATQAGGAGEAGLTARPTFRARDA